MADTILTEDDLAKLTPEQRIEYQHEAVIQAMALKDDEVPKGRGVVLPLGKIDRVARMEYLGRLRNINGVDRWVNRGTADGTLCPDLFYLLKDHNGGKDPTAADPADRWSNPGSKFVNRTVDCIGGQAWVGGFDRYQPVRFSHIYDGWINTDSMIMDAKGPKQCFVSIPEPEAGCYVVCASGSRGHPIGHIGGVMRVNGTKWDPANIQCWMDLDVVDCAARGTSPANARTTARGWFNTNALFVVPIMVP